MVTARHLFSLSRIQRCRASLRRWPNDADSPARGRWFDEICIFRSIAPFLTSLMVLFSIFVLLRGHNEPGGGFIGGLIAASALAIYGIACGVAPVRRAIYFHPMGIAAFGLFMAAMAGVLSVAAGVPYMSGLWIYPELFGVELALSERAGLRCRGLSGPSSAPSVRSRWRSRKGAATDGTPIRRSGGRAFHRRLLPVPVQAHHPRPDGRGDPRQCRQPADLHRRPGNARSSADHRRGRRCADP